jgi:hypothetical protein
MKDQLNRSRAGRDPAIVVVVVVVLLAFTVTEGWAGIRPASATASATATARRWGPARRAAAGSAAG